MTRCTYCGDELEYVGQYNDWYCYNCSRYQSAAQLQYPPPTPGVHPTTDIPGSKPRSKIAVMVVVIIIIMIVLTSLIFYFAIFPQDEKEKTVTMTVKDFQKEVNSWSDRYGDFRSVEPGDIIKIKDNIVNITTGYDFYTGISYTGIKFASTYNDEIYRESDIDLSFIGNLTDKFEIGDNIIITLHVEESRQGTYTFEIIEEFEDIYPGYEYISYGYLAGDCISLA